MCHNNNKGFTLVEVMISAIILFLAIAIGTAANRNTIRIIDKITTIAFVSDALPHIMEMVKGEIMAGKGKGQGHYGESIAYTWRSKEIKSSKNIVSSYDEVTGGLEYGRFKVVLNNIQLNIIYEGEGRRKETQYEYQELSWSS